MELILLGLAAGVFGLAAYPPYIRDIMGGNTRPARATWLIWSILSVIALGSQLSAGAHWSIIMTIAKTLGAVTVAALALRYGSGGLSRSDVVALVSALCGLGLWLFMSQPLIALLLVIAVDAIGSWMTLRKALRQPESETPATWLLNSVSSLLGLLAVGSWRLTLMIYPAYLLLANGVIAGVVVFGQRRQVRLERPLETVKIAANE
jgi:uncharacterized membrane protein YidH (DUF202 family)